MSRFSTAAGQRRRIEATKDLYAGQANQAELIKSLQAGLIKGRTPKGQRDTSYYEQFGLDPIREDQMKPAYDSLTEETIDPDLGRTSELLPFRKKSKASAPGMETNPYPRPDTSKYDKDKLEQYFREDEEKKRAKARDFLIDLQRQQERIPGIREIRPEYFSPFVNEETRNQYIENLKNKGKPDSKEREEAMKKARSLIEVHNEYAEGIHEGRTEADSPLALIKDDGLGEQQKRGGIYHKAFLTKIDRNILEKADLKQMIAQDKKRFRDKSGNLLPPKDLEGKSPIGVTAMGTYLEPKEIAAHLETQILTAIDEGRLDSPIARNVINKLKDPYVDADKNLTHQGREDLINDYAKEQKITRDQAMFEVDSVLGTNIIGDKIELTNLEGQPEFLSDRIQRELNAPDSKRRQMLKEGKRTNQRTILMKANEIMARRKKLLEQGKAPEPLPFQFVLEALHPDINFNELNIKGILFDADGFDAGTIGTNPYIKRKSGIPAKRMMVDRDFALIMNFVTEKFLLQTQYIPTAGDAHPDSQALIQAGVLNQMPTPDTDDMSKNDKRDFGRYLEAFSLETTPSGGIARLAGNSQLGREIFKEWKREQNRRLGRPTDEYSLKGISDNQFEIVGTFARDLWQEVNPDLYKKEQTGDQIHYQLTSKGLAALSNAALAAPDAFRNVEKMPRLVPPQDFIGERTPTRQTTTVINRYIREIEESRKGMSSVPHKFDTLRSKLMKQISGDVLRDAKSQTDLNPLGDLLGLGPQKFLEYRGTFNKKVSEHMEYYEVSKEEAERKVWEKYRPEFEMDKQFTRYLEFLNTMGRYSDKAYHLDFVLQSLQSRMHVDQTRFNPQLIPWVRYATGGVKPTEFKPQTDTSEPHQIFKEHIAKEFISGADKLLPRERIKAFDKELAAHLNGLPSPLNQVIADGKIVDDSLMSDEENAKYNTALAEIKLTVNSQRYQGAADTMDPETGAARGVQTAFDDLGLSGMEYINIPEQVADMPKLTVPDSLMALTRKGGAVTDPSEGLEGIAKIESAIELSRYVNARKNGTVFRTNIGIELDGTTHGPSSFLAMLGAVKAAFRSGVLRKMGATKTLDDLDETTVAVLAEVDGLSEEIQEAKAGDLRDAMKAYMLENGREYADHYISNPDYSDHLYEILKLATQDRDNYLKKPPMTLSYGMLVENLKKTIRSVIHDGDYASEIRRGPMAKLSKAMKGKLPVDETTGKEMSLDKFVIGYLHNVLADAIDSELHPGVVAVGQLLRANNAIAMLTDEVMRVKNAIGVENYIGSKERVVKRDQDGQVVAGEIYLQSSGAANLKARPIVLMKSEPAGSALRDGIPGGWGRGRIIPALIQGIDGAWMNLMFRGKSWEALEGNYMLPIMDAVKTDLRGAGEVRRQANDNWWKVIEEYNPWHSLMEEWAPSAIDNFKNRMGYDTKKKQWVEDPKQIIPFVNWSLTNPGKPYPDNWATIKGSNVSTLAGKGYVDQYASDLSGPYKGFWYLLHNTSPNVEKGEVYGELSLKNLTTLIQDTMEFRPRARKENIEEYNTEKRQAAYKIAELIVPQYTARIKAKKKNPEGVKGLQGMSRENMLTFLDRLEKALKILDRNKITSKELNNQKRLLIDIEKNLPLNKDGRFQVNH